MSQKHLISFDVGIKNMAYCIFDISLKNEIKIIDWKTINLMNEEDKPINQVYICNCKITTKSKKEIKICGKKAKYCKTMNETTNYYCEKHAKENKDYLLPEKQHESTQLKKKKIDELIKICNMFSMQTTTLKKPDIIEKLSLFLKEKSFELIKQKKQKTANEIDIISIGKNMKAELDMKINTEHIQNVLIENQISPIATRMNTIQGMLVQYFIMMNQNINIDFISSSNKLKGLPRPTVETNNDETTKSTIKSTYKEHKKDGIYHCCQYLENNDVLKEWKHVLNTNKKDDYADCFLQGIWYLRKNDLIKSTETNIYDLQI